MINNDPVVGDRLKVIFLPNYNVSLTEKIIPAADLSEQISTVGMEASGTGNMKLALNGALTIGTLDGANIEIRELVGHDNMFIFGLTAEEVRFPLANGYQPRAEVEAAPALAAVYDAISSGAVARRPGSFPAADRAAARPRLFHGQRRSCAVRAATQQAVDQAFRDADAWWRRAVINTAKVGWFSSDRTIRDYASEIWGALPAQP